MSNRLRWAGVVGLIALLALVVASCAPAVTPTPERIVETVEVPVKETVVIEVTTTPAITQFEARCTYQAYRMGWVMDYADANNIINEVFSPKSPFQYTYWQDDTFLDLVDQALVETDAKARAAIWNQAEKIMAEDHVMVVPVFHYDTQALVKSGINQEWPPFGAPHFMLWSFEDPAKTSMKCAIGTEPPTLDINLATDTTSHLILNQLIEGFYRYRGDGSIEPAAAESYEVSDDGLVYTIHLRDDAVWSDGEPVIAQHFVDGIIRLLTPETAAEYAYNMYPVAGAEDFNTGVTDDAATVGVRAIDDLTVEITLHDPAAFFDSILAFSTTYPVRLDVIEEFGDAWIEAGNFVSNGPYVLTEWAHEDHVTIEKNPTYHDADKVTIERVEYPIIYERSTSLAAYENNEIDSTGGWFPVEEIPRILEDPVLSKEFVVTPRPGTWYVGLNTRGEHTDNVHFRRALAMAVDKRTVLDNVLNMPWREVACGVVPPTIPGYQGCGKVGYEFDVDAAKAELQAYMDEAGIADPDEIVIETWFNRGNEDVLEAVQAMWEENLGIHVRLVIMEWAVYLETLDKCEDLGR